MTFPSDNKNQINRSRGSALNEIGADKPFGFESKPMVDEHHQLHAREGGEGLRGEDKSQAALVDGAPRGVSRDVSLAEQRTAHQDSQSGADVRGPFIEAVDTLPEGLRRERKHPINPTQGRGTEIPDHVPSPERK